MMRAIVSRFFPEGTRMSSPAGGYVLWIELPPKVDAMRLYQLALERGITIGPGHMFSTSDTLPATSSGSTTAARGPARSSRR